MGDIESHDAAAQNDHNKHGNGEGHITNNIRDTKNYDVAMEGYVFILDGGFCG